MYSIKKLMVLAFILFILIGCVKKEPIPEKKLKLYWFIPDGVRADPDVFTIYKWAEEGDLPNIKRMMDEGSYGYSIPTFPSHTPTNFATLLTGVYPDKNGVADGPMHIEGRPLDKVAIGGFSSVAKRVDPIWLTLENLGNKVLLLSIPGSTPPELQQGITIRGRWGGWGADFHALNFESKLDLSQRKKQGRGSRLFFFGPELTKYIETTTPENWTVMPKSYSPPKEIKLEGWGSVIYGYIFDSTDNGNIDYDRIFFSQDKKSSTTRLSIGEWSDWIPITLRWNELNVSSQVKINIINLDDDGFFRIRLFYNNLNEYITDPSFVSEDLTENVGPMIDFVDNFPPQLIYYPEDKKTFLEEMNATFEWHTKAIPFIINEYNPDIVIHDIYSPNQMLTSRWWMGYIDPDSKRYEEVNEKNREMLWREVKSMYKELDKMAGEILKNSDENTIIVISSDHGAVPLNKWVNLNNLFAQKGWLKFTINNETGEPIIDWENSTVIYLKMDNVYVNPAGLGGNWTRASGKDYEKLREEVKEVLLSLEDNATKIKPVKAVVKWEDVKDYLDLPPDRVGDFVIANEAGYGWNEEMTEDMNIFDIPLKTGYKQAIFANETKGMWTPFIIMGPGVKKGYKINEPIQHVDQYATIMELLYPEIEEKSDGKILEEIFN